MNLEKHPDHKVLQGFPKDRFQNKADALVRATTKFVLDEHRNTIVGAMHRPVPNKLIKLCAEYIELEMSEHKDFSLTKHSLGWSTTSLGHDLRPGIFEIKIETVKYYIEKNGKKNNHLFDVVDSSNSTDEVELHLDRCVEHINNIISTGMLHACSQLYLNGWWFADSQIYSAIANWLTHTLQDDVEFYANQAEHLIDATIKSEVKASLDCTYLLTKDGGRSAAFPAFLISTVLDKETQQQSVMFPIMSPLGFELSVVTEENNVPIQIIGDLNQVFFGINNIIEQIRNQYDLH